MGRLYRVRPRGAGAGGGGGQAGVVNIPFELERNVAGTGPTFVSSGFLLLAGELLPANTGLVRVFLNTGAGGAAVEQSVNVSALEGRASDGTAKSILVQMQVPSMTYGVVIPGTLRLGELRQTADIPYTDPRTIASMVAPFPAAPNARRNALQSQGFPDGMINPSSVSRLIATDVLEPTISVTEAQALGGVYANLEAEWITFSNRYWAIYGNYVDPMVDGSGAYLDSLLFAFAYYERGATCGHYWMRSRLAEYWRRACAYAFGVRALYYDPNGDNVNEHYMSPASVALHYWLTGDPASREAIHQMALNRYAAWIGQGLFGDKNGPDPRICSRVLDLCVWCARLGYTDVDWSARAATLVDKILGVGVAAPLLRSSGPTGAWAPALCGGVVPDVVFGFMNGMMMQALRRYYRWISADSRIPTAIKLCLDYLTASMYVVGNGAPQSTAVKYLSADCPGEGGAVPAVDLNGFFAANYAWYAKQAGIAGAGASYLATAEALFAPLQRSPHDGTTGPLENDVVSNAYNKQHNECYHDAWPFLSFRQG